MLTAIGKWWRRRQRKIDLQILWPVCCQQARTLDGARFAFYLHAVNDSAWTRDFTLGELEAYIDALEPPK